MAKVKVIKGKDGQKSISFHPGALHKELGVKSGDKIPASKMNAALSGNEGPLARRRAEFAKNVLTGPKK